MSARGEMTVRLGGSIWTFPVLITRLERRVIPIDPVDGYECFRLGEMSVEAIVVTTRVSA